MCQCVPWHIQKQYVESGGEQLELRVITSWKPVGSPELQFSSSLAGRWQHMRKKQVGSNIRSRLLLSLKKQIKLLFPTKAFLTVWTTEVLFLFLQPHCLLWHLFLKAKSFCKARRAAYFSLTQHTLPGRCCKDSSGRPHKVCTHSSTQALTAGPGGTAKGNNLHICNCQSLCVPKLGAAEGWTLGSSLLWQRHQVAWATQGFSFTDWKWCSLQSKNLWSLSWCEAKSKPTCHSPFL